MKKKNPKQSKIEIFLKIFRYIKEKTQENYKTEQNKKKKKYPQNCRKPN